jgi:hypothetical protein
MVRVHADSDGWMPSRQASAVACAEVVTGFSMQPKKAVKRLCKK